MKLQGMLGGNKTGAEAVAINCINRNPWTAKCRLGSCWCLHARVSPLPPATVTRKVQIYYPIIYTTEYTQNIT